MRDVRLRSVSMSRRGRAPQPKTAVSGMRLSMHEGTVSAEISSSLNLPTVAFEIDRLGIERGPGFITFVGESLDGRKRIQRIEARTSVENFESFRGSITDQFRKDFEKWLLGAQAANPDMQAVSTACEGDLSPDQIVRLRFQIGRLSHVGFDGELLLYGFSAVKMVDAKRTLEKSSAHVELIPLARLTFSSLVLPAFLKECMEVVGVKSSSSRSSS